MAKRYAIVLAAGQGTRMKSKLYKVLHPVLGRPMVQHVIDNVKKVQLEEIVTVVGHGAEKVKEYIGNKSQFVIQEEQLGTGHACMQAEDLLKDKHGSTIVVCGDTPLISSETYQALFDFHEKENAKATVLTAKAPHPNGYGRVLRDDENQVVRIVEHKDANEQERSIDEINTGTYCFDNQALFTALKEVNNDNAQNEYYLPDVIEILKNQSDKVSAFMTPDFDETMGVNDRVALSAAEKVMKRRINELHMRNGVTIIDPEHTYIEPDVIINQDVIVYPGTMISGQTQIKENAEIGPNTEIVNSMIGENTTIRQSVVKNSEVKDRVSIGPYAHIRPETRVEDNAKIGNFVELKKTDVGENSKVSHLSYMGDTTIGSNVNVGCGTITVNYDGQDKYVTTIKDDAFVGCNSNLIAPVTIGQGAYVAAGSTITHDVPDESLSIARSRQTNKDGYAKKIRGNKQ